MSLKNPICKQCLKNGNGLVRMKHAFINSYKKRQKSYKRIGYYCEKCGKFIKEYE